MRTATPKQVGMHRAGTCKVAAKTTTSFFRVVGTMRTLQQTLSQYLFSFMHGETFNRFPIQSLKGKEIKP